MPALLLLAAGCISWDEGWKTKFQATGQGEVKALLASASSLESSANSADNVKNVIAAYEKVIAVDPVNYNALSKLGEFTHLYAYIYSTDRNVKAEYYLKSLNYCERAMYTNPKFKALADQGKPVWECVDVLTVKEMEAMFYWYVAAGQYWTECFNSIYHLFNFRLPGKVKIVLQKMSSLDPDWGYGRVHMAWGAFYSIVPGFMGGDDTKAAEEFTKSNKVAPQALHSYYLRARYLHVKNKNREAFKKDLEYVLAADVKKINFPYQWAIGYQIKAKELLGQIDKLFKQ